MQRRGQLIPLLKNKDSRKLFHPVTKLSYFERKYLCVNYPGCNHFHFQPREPFLWPLLPLLKECWRSSIISSDSCKESWRRGDQRYGSTQRRRSCRRNRLQLSQRFVTSRFVNSDKFRKATTWQTGSYSTKLLKGSHYKSSPHLTYYNIYNIVNQTVLSSYLQITLSASLILSQLVLKNGKFGPHLLMYLNH